MFTNDLDWYMGRNVNTSGSEVWTLYLQDLLWLFYGRKLTFKIETHVILILS